MTKNLILSSLVFIITYIVGHNILPRELLIIMGTLYLVHVLLYILRRRSQ